MAIEKIRKRDGRIVDFDRTKIEKAVEKAFAATGMAGENGRAVSIADKVVAELEGKFAERMPGVEDVQDIVERQIAEAGFFEVAKVYILYRKEHEELREEKKKAILEKIEQSALKVRKRDGSIAGFDIREIEKAVENCCRGFETAADIRGIVDGCKSNIYDGISTREINQAVIMSIRTRIEVDPVYSYIGARFLFNDLYKDVLGRSEFEENFTEKYISGFRVAMERGVASGRLSKELLSFDFEKLGAALRPERDTLFTYLGAQTLYDRYFLRNLEQEILEVPQYFWMRVAMGLALGEKDRETKAVDFYEAMSRLLYVPSTPTLFHSGTVHPQMSSCYLTTVMDDLHHIFKSIGDNAQLSKWSGGLGNDWSNIRGTGALIKTTNVGSQGVIPFLKIVDAATAAINRSGKRRGATVVYLETWHYDIESFLELRKNTGDERRRTHDTNTANWIPDLFMKRVINGGDWTLFSPDEAPDLHHLYGRVFEAKYEEYEKKADRGEMKLWKRMKAETLWRKMIGMLFETGHPWITFKDPCNIRSPQDHAGVVHSSNLCTEITLNTSAEETAVCNLGSINLSRHTNGGELDKALLERTVTTAVRILDNVIDLNFYPTREAENANLKHRPIGLGIMGFQNVLYKMGMRFDSDEAVFLSDEIMEFISYHAISASSDLAKEKGPYSTFGGSKWSRGIFPLDTLKLLEEEREIPTGLDFSSRLNWDELRQKVKSQGMRNSNCLAIAPTATISNISGCLPSIEPIYKNLYVKSNSSGEFTVTNEYLIEDLKKLNLWNADMMEKLKYHDGSVQKIFEIPVEVRERYKEVFEIDPNWIVRHAAYRGKWIDQSQSVNIFTSSDSGRLISNIYTNAWQVGLKTTYYLRTLAASAVEKSTLDINKNYESVEIPKPKVIAVASDSTCEACQ